ncbi:MAG: hypothetical protein J1E62_02415 [Lachnospiraceae bacterium]|nr:hypothetical protein [Lachnospiraceae bacterium]
MPTFFVCFIVFIICVQVKMKRNARVSTWDQAFWQKEKDANFARKQDISDLEYLKVDLSLLPFQENASETVQDAQNDVRQTLQHPILNLNGMTNADIKLKYGLANFEHLSACDQNYLKFIRTLDRWGSALYEDADYQNAALVYEYALEIGSDISRTYTTLATIYAETDQIEKVQKLIDRIRESDSFMRDTIAEHLMQIIQKY